MLTDNQLVFKEHAVERMLDRGITKEQVRRAIERGSKFKQTDGMLSTYTYFSVAYKKMGDKYTVKTIIING